MNRDFALWVGILGGPIVWLISFEANFALVPWTCIWQGKLTLYIVHVLAFLASGGAALLAWNQWSNLGRDADPQGGDTLSRSRIMAFSGVILSGFSCLIIIAQAIPELVLGACQ